MSARSVLENALLDEMLDSTVLRSGFMDRFCVVLFEVGVVSFSVSPAPLRPLVRISRGHSVRRLSSCYALPSPGL